MKTSLQLLILSISLHLIAEAAADDIRQEPAVVASPKVNVSLLVKIPDLSPHLSGEEVSEHFNRWVELVNKITPGLKSEFQSTLSGARSALGAKLPQVTSLTLYSLFPVAASDIQRNENPEAEEFQRLPRFHEFPVLGQLKIDDTAQANQWVDFFRDQIIPGDFSACDFKPRHGFRLSTANGDIDILMCYDCNDLALIGSMLENKHKPVLSPATRDQINQLFDKLNIRRDVPAKVNK
ncbi:hypothetical protein WJU23_14710 [Prosthecobacter sp. SYSU 5D2]|uniref:hypothetical protein n=1 Tax=Prosthecobacter sp. SYSU 5D2 TaxID=3134134 RepID=UPI0031FF3520